MRRRLVLLLLLALVAAGSPGTAAEPPRAAARVLAVTLDNGLRVLLLEDHRSPIVSLQLWYRVGSRNEAGGAPGIAHFPEHLMFRGTPTNPPRPHPPIDERNGGQAKALTS